MGCYLTSVHLTIGADAQRAKHGRSDGGRHISAQLELTVVLCDLGTWSHQQFERRFAIEHRRTVSDEVAFLCARRICHIRNIMELIYKSQFLLCLRFTLFVLFKFLGQRMVGNANLLLEFNGFAVLASVDFDQRNVVQISVPLKTTNRSHTII